MLAHFVTSRDKNILLVSLNSVAIYGADAGTKTETSEQIVNIISYFYIPLLSCPTRVNGNKHKELSTHSVQQFTLIRLYHKSDRGNSNIIIKSTKVRSRNNSPTCKN